jgi:hypothetical protein
MKKIIALVLALLVAMSMTAAFAADLGNDEASNETGVYEGNANSIDIKTAVIITNNETTAANGKTIYYPAMSFTHSYEPATVTDTTTVTDGSVTAHVKTGVAGALTITETAISAGNVTLNANGQAVVYAKTNFAVDLTKFESAGIYRYKVTDTSIATGSTNLTALQSAGVVQGTSTDTEYFLDVYLKNGESGLEIGGYVLSSANTTAITTSENDKESGFDDITVGADGELQGEANLDTNYSYTTYNVTLHKAVKGAMGDKNNPFPFTVDVTNNSLNFGYEETGSHNTTCNITLTYGNDLTSITMSDGSTLKIWGLSPFAKVNYTETNNTLDTYKVKVGTAADGEEIKTQADVTNNGTMAAWTETHAVADNYAITTTATLNADADAVYYTNTLDQISPTGVVLRFAPYIAMLAGGVLLLVLSRKRRSHKDED